MRDAAAKTPPHATPLIPHAQADVESFLAKFKIPIEIAFQYLNELLQKYRFMEMHMQKNKAKLRTKLPEITQTLNMIKFLEKKAVRCSFLAYSFQGFRFGPGVSNPAIVVAWVCLWGCFGMQPFLLLLPRPAMTTREKKRLSLHTSRLQMPFTERLQ